MTNGKACTTSVLDQNIKKRVTFNPNVQILNMCAWTFAYHEARKSDCGRIAADKYRFELRKQRLEEMLSKIVFFF